MTTSQGLTGQTITKLEPASSSASAARRVVEAAVLENSLAGFIDEALLLVTELVTNAIVHAGTEIELRVEAGHGSMRVEVVDQSPGLITIAHEMASETREGGRGLLLLDALATEWGTRHFGWGKSVWFQLGAVAVPQQPQPVDPAPPAELLTSARPTASAALSRQRPHDAISWLVSLPADIEQKLRPDQVIAELLHRLAAGVSIAQCWAYSHAADDEQRWVLVAALDSLSVAPDADAVRRASERGFSELPDSDVFLLRLQGASGVFGAVAILGGARLDAEQSALVKLVAERIAVILRDDLARAAQLRSRGSLALLAEASEMFAGTLDVQLAMTLATQLVVPRFARWAAVWSTYEHQPRITAVTHADENRLPELQSALGGIEGEQLASTLARNLVERRPNLVHGSELPTELVEERSGEVLALPLVARRRLLGVLIVGRPAGAIFGSDDVGLLNDLARRTAVAVDSARLYEESTSVARALQASLLPPTLPDSPVVEFGARYAAAGEGNEVGGDFYDVFDLGRHSAGWGIAIGDVCGKGPEAAAITGMARDVLRLLMRDGLPIPAALRRLNGAILDLGERGRFCTATLGRVEPDADRLNVTLSLAGHPAPVLVRADGTVKFFGRSGTLLGVFPELRLNEDNVALEPGDSLVFYTDGVTERRSAGLMFGDDNLMACLREAAGQSADAMAGLLEEHVQRFGLARDDLAVLVVRCTKQSVHDPDADVFT
ncbi:MAG: SpoIIE family protein phosphatase [Acidothermaceae bacterium]